MEEKAEIARLAGEAEYEAAQKLLRESAVRLLGTEQGGLVYAVGRQERRIVTLPAGERPEGRCGCGTPGLCRHAAAALLEALASGRLSVARRQRRLSAADRLRSAFSGALPEGPAFTLEPCLHLPDDPEEPWALSLRTGQERLYVVRSIPQLLEALAGGAPVSFGKKEQTPVRGSYGPRDRELLALLETCVLYGQPSGAPKRAGAAARTAAVPKSLQSRLLSLLQDRPFRLSAGGHITRQEGIAEGRADFSFTAGLRGREIEVRALAPRGLRLLDPETGAALLSGELLRLDADQRAVLQAMRGEEECVFTYTAEQRMDAVSFVLPHLQAAGHTVMEGRLRDRLVNRPLAAEARLDRADEGISCSLLFRYGDAAVDPFGAGGQAQADDLLLVRDAEGERRVLDVLASCGFRQSAGAALLHGQEAIWRFLTGGLPRLQEAASVWLSDAFRRLRPRRASLSGRVGLRGSALQLELLLDGEPFEDTEGVLAALRAKRTWYRLKSGAFLDLSDFGDWQELAEASGAQDREEKLPVLEVRGARALWLMNLLREKRLPVGTDASAEQAFDVWERQEPCPEALRGEMRPYQARGFAWLQSLYRLGMGGILADDMGLGKTLQVIALLLWAKEREGGRPSVIVAPTSLIYNWAAEIRRFAPSLTVLIAGGQPAQRERQIAQLSGARAPDVYLTSYPLLRRDVTLLRGADFRFAVLDEAQYIKNAAGAGAGAVRALKAAARFALTGTPMENHPGELWSIFDAVLPGYLPGYARFMQRYGAGGDAEQLRRRIRPFLLRRLKRDVLSDLPEKSEAVLTAEMTPEQRRVYRAALQRLRPEDIPLSGGGRFRVLAALTELREACSHPALILPDYVGSSGKLDLLMDLLPGALESGHRALIFSQFTRMLRLIERRLDATGIESFYLDGETPARERMDRVQRFNGGEGQVFLISLKAGGAGLNLTGADWVIHYDPWWNPAAEDQATDRAHRIGQTRNVTVMRLVTRDSVEEQVVRLGERKRALFERMIEAGESIPTQLTEAEIRALFADG